MASQTAPMLAPALCARASSCSNCGGVRRGRSSSRMRWPPRFPLRCSRSNSPVHRALAILVVAKRLQRQRLQKWLLFGEHCRHLSLGSAMDAGVGPVRFPVLQIRLRLFRALESLALQRLFLCMANAGLALAFAIRIALF